MSASATSAAPAPAAAFGSSARPVARVNLAHRQREGGGFVVRRPFPSGGVDHIGGLFLMVDHLGPTEYGPGEAVGAPTHPHRGFTTLTYILEGEMEHKDSVGNTGKLSAGWCQYMRAGSGVLHSEMPSKAFTERGGRMEGFQIWLNLPAAKKMSPPRYQDTPPEAMPVVPLLAEESDGAGEGEAPVGALGERGAAGGGAGGAGDGASTVKVLCGTYNGAKSPIESDTPLRILDARLAAGASASFRIPAGHVGVVYAYRGNATVGTPATALPEGAAAIVGGASGSFTLRASADAPVSLLLLHGERIAEPIARYGPFVMNTREQLIQAFEDYEAGRLGSIEGAEEEYARTKAAREAQKASGRWSDEL